MEDITGLDLAGCRWSIIAVVWQFITDSGMCINISDTTIVTCVYDGRKKILTYGDLVTN